MRVAFAFAAAARALGGTLRAWPICLAQPFSPLAWRFVSTFWAFYLSRGWRGVRGLQGDGQGGRHWVEL